jgi:hypothetical protein
VSLARAGYAIIRRLPRLRTVRGRLTITSKKGVDLDVHISELQNLHAPLWMLMCGLYFDAAGKKWYVTFSEVRDIDWSALRTFTPRLGLALAEIQDLKNQALLSMVWMMLLDTTPPVAKTADAPVVRSADDLPTRDQPLADSGPRGPHAK